jgi:hypothetical protein
LCDYEPATVLPESDHAGAANASGLGAGPPYGRIVDVLVDSDGFYFELRPLPARPPAAVDPPRILEAVAVVEHSLPVHALPRNGPLSIDLPQHDSKLVQIVFPESRFNGEPVRRPWGQIPIE